MSQPISMSLYDTFFGFVTFEMNISFEGNNLFIDRFSIVIQIQGNASVKIVNSLSGFLHQLNHSSCLLGYVALLQQCKKVIFCKSSFLVITLLTKV